MICSDECRLVGILNSSQRVYTLGKAATISGELHSPLSGENHTVHLIFDAMKQPSVN